MRSNNSGYRRYDSEGSRSHGRSARHQAAERQSYEVQSPANDTNRQGTYGYDRSYQPYQGQEYDRRYTREPGVGYQGERYGHAASQQAEYRQASQPQGQAYPAHGRRQTAADLGQVDNSQVAGRVAYDQDGNLVVVKKEEKAPVQMAAIVGSALSAVTSALFSSHIGIGGSLLTVAIGAAVSAAGTQLYTHVIKKSTDKLKSVVDNGLPNSQQITGVMDSSQLDANGYGYEAEQTVFGYESDEGTPTADGGRIAPQGMIDAAEERHQKQVRRRGVIVVAIMALVAVIAAAGVVSWATKGNGIGAKTPSIVGTVSSTANENENETASAAQAPEAPAAATNANATADAQGSPAQATTGASDSTGGGTSTAANQQTNSSTTGTTAGGSGSSTGNAGATAGTGSSSTTANAAGSGTGASSVTSASNGSASTASDSSTAASGANASDSSSTANASGAGSSTGGAPQTSAQTGSASSGN